MPIAIRSLRNWCGALAALPLCACSTVGYYAHLAHGEAALLAARKPVARVLADPAADGRLKARLQLAQQARAFASERLALPRNRSYTNYADLHRAYAMWNVFAAPEFSLQPFEHCFPIAGCVAYRGYYTRERADAYAARLRARGMDTWVGGVTAYSTLGFFADPILNTMLRWDDDELAATIFHELAHQRLYVKGDTEFNESYATFVQREGLSQWRASRGLPPESGRDQARADEFNQLVMDARERLQAVYASAAPPQQMRERKQAEIARLRADYVQLRDARWSGDPTYDRWIDGEINNATLLPFGLYHRWVGAFAALYTKYGSDWAAFHAAARQLAQLRDEARTKALLDLQSAAH